MKALGLGEDLLAVRTPSSRSAIVERAARGRYSAVEALAKLLRLGAEGADVSYIAELVVNDARVLVGSDLAALLIIEDRSFRTAAVVGNLTTDVWHETLPIQPGGTFEQAVRSGRANVSHIDDLPYPPSVRLLSRMEGAATSLCVPILASPGILFLAWHSHAEPTDEQVSIAETLANCAGTIFDAARARQAEAERSAQLAAIVDNMPNGVIVLDQVGRELMRNHAMEQILPDNTDRGRPIMDQAQPMRSAVTGRSLSRDELPIARALAGEAGVKDMLLVRRPSQFEDTCLMVSATPLRDMSGQVTGAVAVMSDITKETLLQRQVRRYADQLERVYETMACGVMVIGKHGPMYANRAARRILCLPQDVPMSMLVDQLPPLVQEDGSELPFDQAPGRLAYKTGARITGMVLGQSLPAEGRVQWHQADAVPVCDEDGKVEFAIVSFVDISERKATRQALEDHVEFLHATMASIGEGIYATDQHGCLMLMNHQAEVMLGWTQAELVGKNLHAIIHNRRPDGSPLAPEDCSIGDTLQSGAAITAADEVFVRRDGSLFPVSYAASPLRSQGQLSGVVVAFHDIGEQKQAEAALRASEDRYRDLVDHSWDMICTHDTTGRILFANKSAAESLGYAPEDLVGRNLVETLAPDVRDDFGDYLTAVLRDGVAHGLAKVITKSGEHRLCEYRNTLRTEGVAEPVVRATARDVTEARRAENELRRSEGRFRALVEESSEMIALTDSTGVMTYVSPAVMRVLGWDPGELEGKSPEPFIHPEDLAKQVEMTLRLLDEPGSQRPLNYRALHKDGTWRHMRGVVTNLLHDPAVGALVANEHDVTASLAAQAALEESEERYRIIVETAFEGIWAIDLEACTTFANAQMARMLGCRVESMQGRHLFDFVEAELRPELEARLRRRHAGRSERYEARFRRTDGSALWVLVSANPLFGNNGEVTGSLAMMTDITERKHLEAIRRQTAELEAENERIVHSSEVRAQFFATMSHELRSPLNAIIGMAELLERGRFGELAPRPREMAGRLLASSEHLLKLVNGVLDLAKLEAGKLDFDPEPVSLRDVVGDVIATLAPAAAAKGVTVSQQVEAQLDHAYLDVTRLRQVLYNYISNAVKFSPPGGTVTVRLLPAGQHQFRIEVEDCGEGIAAEDLPKLFREFGQLPNAGQGKDKGTGLGLAITKRIVESQGGRVGVTSTPRAGSVFYAVLPLRQERESPTIP